MTLIKINHPSNYVHFLTDVGLEPPPFSCRVPVEQDRTSSSENCRSKFIHARLFRRVLTEEVSSHLSSRANFLCSIKGLLEPFHVGAFWLLGTVHFLRGGGGLVGFEGGSPKKKHGLEGGAI